MAGLCQDSIAHLTTRGVSQRLQSVSGEAVPQTRRRQAGAAQSTDRETQHFALTTTGRGGIVPVACTLT